MTEPDRGPIPSPPNAVSGVRIDPRLKRRLRRAPVGGCTVHSTSRSPGSNPLRVVSPHRDRSVLGSWWRPSIGCGPANPRYERHRTTTNGSERSTRSGAIGVVNPTVTAYSQGGALPGGIAAGWSDSAPDNELTGWPREFHEALAPHCTCGARANYLDDDDDDCVESGFGATYARSAELKSRWDPDNRFRLNQNLQPAG